MITKGLVKKGEYHDSVTLMRVAKFFSEQSGVEDSAVVMATQENKHILNSAGLTFSELAAAGETDLVLVVKTSTAEEADTLLSLAAKELKAKKSNSSTYQPKSLDSALQVLPAANLVMISVAGRYAGDEAMKALERGLHVMLFSDNVSIEKEIELKTYAASRGLLVMGPDCGTAIINGVPLAFANNVMRGSVGIVAASGTGLQEASTLISQVGAGISQAIGTGGRDVKKEVGGIMFLQAVKALLADEETSVLLLISKPPHESVLKKIVELLKDAKKPVVATFLGADSNALVGTKIISTVSLAEGALKAAFLAQDKTTKEVDQKIQLAQTELDRVAATEVQKLAKGQKYLRGLYTGGTFVSETQVLLAGKLTDVYSNAPYGASKSLADSMKSEAHTVIDFGEDEFTVGRPHPMIDFSLRNHRILDEARDPATAVLLLDLVLGWGANMAPLPELVPILNEARLIATKAGRYLPIIMSVTGTDSDPQCRQTVVDALCKAGAYVAPSNAAAARLAIKIAEGVK